MGKLIDGQFAQRADLALRKDGEPPDNGGMETRIVKLEVGAAHVQDNIGELRKDVRELRGDMKELRADMKLLLGALVGVALGLAGLMAKGFHWL